MSNRLLVVDDDPEVRKTLVLLFGTSCEVLEASTGEEALRIIEVERPRLMLLDMTMPGMSGLEVLQALRDTAEAMTIIMLTSKSDVELAKRALDLGAVEYMTKPFDWSHLKEKVTRSMGLASGLGSEKEGRWLPWRTVIGPIHDDSQNRGLFPAQADAS